jgi:hypothetical protein
MQKSAHFYYLSSQKNHLKSSEKFIYLLKNFPVEWKENFHSSWPGSIGLNSRIILLFLISKNRNQSKFVYVKFLVKGIALKIVKYLCMYEKLKEEIEKEEN